ncbi:MAG: hypothetical protein J6S85_23855 [Methanobrevibacter sp.]|nr:hypothetical protein [Methanobrevibacter sp.]
MRKIDEWMIETIKRGKVGIHCNSNTVVRITECGACRVSLFGNLIYCKSDNGAHYFTMQGYNSLTTRARLNAIFSYYFPQYKISTSGGKRGERWSGTPYILDGKKRMPIQSNTSYQIFDDGISKL